MIEKILPSYLMLKFKVKKVSWIQFIRVQANNDAYEYLYRICLAFNAMTILSAIIVFFNVFFHFMNDFTTTIYIIMGTTSLGIALILGLFFRLEINLTLVCVKYLNFLYKEFESISIKVWNQISYYNQMQDGYINDEYMEEIC